MSKDKEERAAEILRAKSILTECCELNKIDPSVFFGAVHGIVVRHLKSCGASREEVFGFLQENAQHTFERWENL